MKKIFISHNQDFMPAKAMKKLINMLGGQGMLVEDESGVDSPAIKCSKIMAQCAGLIAICTNDIPDTKNGGFVPKHNVVLEIQEWLKTHDPKSIVILKEKGCQLPLLLGAPTYHEFDGTSILLTAQRALEELQAAGLLQYDPSSSAITQSKSRISEDEDRILTFLIERSDREASVDEIKRCLKLSDARWNIAQSNLDGKNLIYVNYQTYDETQIIITDEGIRHLSAIKKFA